MSLNQVGLFLWYLGLGSWQWIFRIMWVLGDIAFFLSVTFYEYLIQLGCGKFGGSKP